MTDLADADAPPRPLAVAPTAPEGGRTARDLGLERAALALGTLIVVVRAAATLTSRSMWHDEAYTLAAVSDLGLSLESTHATMGLYYVLLWPWAQISTATWWLRLPSVLFAVVSLVVVRDVARRVGGSRLAAVAVPLLALVPVFANKATEARSYSLAIMLTCVAWWLVLRAEDEHESGRREWWSLGLVAVAVAGTLAHGLFVIHLVPLLGLALIGRRPMATALRVLPAVVAAAAVAWALRSNGAERVGVTFNGGFGEWASVTAGAYFAGPTLVQALLVATWAVGAGVSLRRARRASQPVDRLRWCVPVLWTVGPAIVLSALSTAYPLNHPRYLASITPGIALTSAVAVVAVGRRLSRDLGTPLRVTSIAVAAGAAVLLTVALVATPNPDGQDWRTTARTVASEAMADDAVLFANVSNGEPEQHRPPFEAAWREVAHGESPTVVSSSRPLGSVRRYEDDPRSPEEMAAAARLHPRIWVVDGGTGASVGIGRILDDPGFAGLELVEHWERDDGIDLRLYAWTLDGTAEPEG